MKFIKNHQGYALFLTILVLMLVSVIGISLLTITANANKTTIHERENQALFYIAEAGINLEKYNVLNVLKELDEEIKASFKNLDPNMDEEELQNLYYKKLVDVFCEKYSDCKYGSTHYLEEQFSKKPKAETEVSIRLNQQPIHPIITITSRGSFEEYPAQSRTVTQELHVNIDVKIQPKEGGNDQSNEDGRENKNEENVLPLENFTVFTKRDIELKGSATIHGNAGSIQGNISLDGGSTITRRIAAADESNLKYPDWMQGIKEKFTSLPEFLQNSPSKLDHYLPEFPDKIFQEGEDFPLPKDYEIVKDYNKHWVIKDGHLNATSYLADNFTLTLNNDTRLKSINITGSNTITIDIGNKDINLLVDNLNISQGHIKIIGSGTLNIYAKKISSIGGSCELNVNGNPASFNIFYNGTAPLSFAGGAKVNGSLYVKQSDLSLSGGFAFYGNIYSGGSMISISGGVPTRGQWIVAPNATLSLTGGGNVTGTVIANSIKADGGTNIKYGEPIVPNPAVPPTPNTPKDTEYNLDTDFSDPFTEQPLVEIDK